MKLLTLALISAAILGGVVGTLLVRDPGYIMVVYGDTVFETSFWVGVVLLLAHLRIDERRIGAGDQNSQGSEPFV